VDKLDDDAADKLGEGAAQVVFDERLEQLPGRCGHGPESKTRHEGCLSIHTRWALSPSVRWRDDELIFQTEGGEQ
jgi:hypothetical protein